MKQQWGKRQPGRKRFFGIRRQLTFKTVGMVCIAFGVCYLLTYYYFSHILQQRALEDNISILEQHIQQLEYLNGDVRNLAETLAVSQGVQKALSNQNLAAALDRPLQGEQLVQLHNAMSDARRTCSSKRYFRRGILAALDDTGFYWGYSAGVYYRQKVEIPRYLRFQRNGETSLFYGPDSGDNLVYLLRVQDIARPQKDLGAILLSVNFGFHRESIAAAAGSFSGYLILGPDETVIVADGLQPDYVRRHGGEVRNVGEVRITETPEGYLLSRTEPVSGWQVVAFADRVNLAQGGRVILPFVTVALALTILFCLLLIRPTVSGIVRPLETLTEAMERISAGHSETDLPVEADNEVGVLAGTFRHMLEDLNRSMRESVEHEQKQQRLQMELLLSHMNPHFIYNTLNSIVYMARRQKNGDIVRLTTAFIRILQDIIPEEGGGLFTTIGREMEIVRAYLTIQHYRYADLFEEEIRVAAGVKDWPIPRFILQPMVENAIFHGLNPKGGGGLLIILAEEEEGLASIRISDNGVGMEPERVRHLLEGGDPSYSHYGTRSIGVANIRARLEGIYGGAYRLNICSTPGVGTTFQLHLPPRVEETTPGEG